MNETKRKEKLQQMGEGFRINWMNMRDADSGTLVWESSSWPANDGKEVKIEVPKDILRVKTVSREMNFSSKEMIRNFRLVQQVLLHGKPLEEWKFDFGFVIPGSTNSWQCVIEAAGEGKMIPAHILSGNVTISTTFFDGEHPISNTVARVFYT